jgi:hypothetical protein
MAKDQFARRVIAFNLRDPLQRKLYEHTLNYTNFSAYGKALILADYVNKDSNRRANYSAN